MKQKLKRDYVQILMHDIQKARSIFYESNGGNTPQEKDTCDALAQLSEPWLFGKQCLLPTLGKVLNEEIEDSLMVNLSSIAQRSQMLRIIGVGSKRHDPTIEEIYGMGIEG